MFIIKDTQNIIIGTALVEPIRNAAGQLEIPGVVAYGDTSLEAVVVESLPADFQPTKYLYIDGQFQLNPIYRPPEIDSARISILETQLTQLQAVLDTLLGGAGVGGEE
jgi:hypothetical protein